MIAVFIKELLDTFRDRRVILNTLILGPLLGPVLFSVMISFVAKQETERRHRGVHQPDDESRRQRVGGDGRRRPRRASTAHTPASSRTHRSPLGDHTWNRSLLWEV